MFKIVSFIFSIAIFLNAQIYEDMLGTKIEIKKVEKIHAATPTLLYSLYAIDKDKIADFYKDDFINSLKDKKINHLSGGELRYLEIKLILSNSSMVLITVIS